MIPAIKPHAFLHDPHRPIKLDGLFVVQLITTTQRCPKCNEPGKWRMGQEFDHEMRCPHCSSMEGSMIWEPGKAYLLIETDGRVFPTEATALASTGDVTMRDADILSHFGVTMEEHLPDVEVHPEGVTIDLRLPSVNPADAKKEAQLQDAALARSGLSPKALKLIETARKENIDKLKLDGAFDPVTGNPDPSWT